MFTLQCILFIASITLEVLSVPPSVCRADFRWEDCGKPAKPVMYYWKLGSRCEVGLWKGCLPNPNMFSDEYQCINTCVFQEKPIEREPEPEPEPEPLVTTESGNDTIGNITDSTNDTNTDTSNGPTESNGSDTTAAASEGTDTEAPTETPAA